MVRLRWTGFDGKLTATRRGYVAKVWWAEASDNNKRVGWSVKAPVTGITHMGRTSSIEQAKRKARNLLVKLTPEVEKKEQLALSGTR